MEPADGKRLTLELDLDSESFSDAATGAPGTCERFSGWIGLAAAVEAWRTAALASQGEVPA